LIEHDRRPFCLTWTDPYGQMIKPDLMTLPRPDVTVTPIALDPEVQKIWQTSRVIHHGDHEAFPVIKLSHPDEFSRQQLEREFHLILRIHREVPGLPIVQIDSNPIVDSKGVIWGFRMQRLFKRDVACGSEDQSAAKLRDIRAAVGRLHEAGFCHCDLQQANIMKDESGEITLVDFGLSGRIGEDREENFTAFSLYGLSGKFTASNDLKSLDRIEQKAQPGWNSVL
ncbi:hypothetical protein BD289DRAFT_367990, partial [Coniella lustricola]